MKKISGAAGAFYKIIAALFAALAAAGCQYGSYSSENLFHQLTARALSLNRPQFQTCVFDPGSSIAHFPMYHFPAGDYTAEMQEEIIQSQFQLMHTLLDYLRRQKRPIAVFDEHITSDLYNPQHYQILKSGGGLDQSYIRVDNTKFYLSERLRTAEALFPVFPSHYEFLSQQQKQFLLDTGASRTLYLLGELPQLHKVISPDKWKQVRDKILQLRQFSQKENYNWWVFNYRENELKQEVLRLLNSPGGRQKFVFIAYGANHDFSDDFFGFHFQSGHNFCRGWMSPPT